MEAETNNRKCTDATTRRGEREPSEQVVVQWGQAQQQTACPPRASMTGGGLSTLVTGQGSRGRRGSERLGAPSASVERRLSSVASMTSLPEEGARGPETSVEDDSVARL